MPLDSIPLLLLLTLISCTNSPSDANDSVSILLEMLQLAKEDCTRPVSGINGLILEEVSELVNEEASVEPVYESRRYVGGNLEDRLCVFVFIQPVDHVSDRIKQKGKTCGRVNCLRSLGNPVKKVI